MSTVWRTKVRRVDGRLDCNHLSDQPCLLCEEDKAKPIKMPAVHTFRGGIYEHMFHPWETPYEITSREQLREESIKRGVVSKDLKDSMHFRHNPDRWV